MFIDGEMPKPPVIHPYHGLLFSNKDTEKNLHGSAENYTESTEPVPHAVRFHLYNIWETAKL